MLVRNDGERNGTDGRMAQTGNDRPIYTNMSAKVSVHATKGESAPKLPSSKREKMLAFERKMNEVGKVLLCSAWLKGTHISNVSGQFTSVWRKRMLYVHVVFFLWLLYYENTTRKIKTIVTHPRTFQ